MLVNVKIFKVIYVTLLVGGFVDKKEQKQRRKYKI